MPPAAEGKGARKDGRLTDGWATELETREWIEALEYVLAEQGPDRARDLLEDIIEHARISGVRVPFTANTPYVNTIPSYLEPEYPGNRELERHIKSVVRWNALAMVVKANTRKDEAGNKIQVIAIWQWMDIGADEFTSRQFG